MDYKAFITAVDERLKKMEEIQKTTWIYEMARTVAKEKRTAFLDGLNGIKNIQYELSVKEINAWCDQIASGTIYFIAETDEYNSDYDWNENWVMRYYDEYQIIPFFEKAIYSAYQMMMNKAYQSAEATIKRLLSLEFTYIEDDDNEFGILTVQELIREDLLEINLKEATLILLYSCYQSNQGQARINKLYHYFKRKECEDLVLTDLFTFGPERIKDETAFMKQWCTFLKNQKEDRVKTLLSDACIYIGGTEYLSKCAKECVKLHPGLFLIYCKRCLENHEDMKCIEAAELALTKIEADKAIRNDICDIAIQASKRIGYNNDQLFYTEAFCADPSAVHLFHLLKQNDTAMKQKALNSVKHLKVSYHQCDQSENRIAAFRSEELQCVCRFMLGEHHEIIRLCQNDNKALGWSCDIKGIIIPLLLICLKQTGKRTVAEASLIKQLSGRLSYKDIYDDFEAALAVWQNTTPFTKAEKQEYIKWLHQEIIERSKAILSGNYRKSYWKAAALLIVLGSVEEENGRLKASEHLKQLMKAEHYRKRSFWSEMKELALPINTVNTF